MKLSSNMAAVTGVVVIGRNEGERLGRCLKSVRGSAEWLAYVDSGSTDDSVAMSRAMGIEVVELDLSTPFTAARARNEGLWSLLKLQPELRYVFFVDGDCEVVGGWLGEAIEFLENRPDVAVVAGWRRERHPDRSVYNLLCDMEWGSAAPGEAKACGGDAVMRVAAFRQVKGYRTDLICGEEPEICVRLRTAGWRIWILDREMTIHDAALYRFGQWWKRALRGGYAYAQGKWLHGAPPERHRVRESRSAWLWGLGIPVFVLLLTGIWSLKALWLLAVYPIQFARVAACGKRSVRENLWRATAMVVCKFPEVVGQMKFHVDRLRHVRSGLIEYK